MMQDINKDFDLLVRSMLEDAEVRPPRGAWRKISARLGALDSSAHTHWNPAPVFKWAGVALACAAVAVGVFISLPDNVQTPELVRGALVAESGPEIVTPLPGAPAPIGYEAAARLTEAAVADEAEIPEVAFEDYEETAEAADFQEQESGGGTVAGHDYKSRHNNTAIYTKDSSGTMTGEADPFALAAFEENKTSRKSGGGALIYAKGAFGGNDPNYLKSSPIASLAPGTASTGISELSTSTYGVPVTAGLGVRVYLLPKFSIGTGVDYSLLTRTFTGTYTETSGSGGTEVSEAGDVQHNIQYLGVPVDLYYDILGTDRILFYVHAGGEVEWCVSNKYTLYTNPEIHYSEPVSKLQYSVGAGIGVEFKLASFMGLYLDPGVRYYFPSGQPTSIRTAKPMMINFDFGLRFSL